MGIFDRRFEATPEKTAKSRKIESLQGGFLIHSINPENGLTETYTEKNTTSAGLETLLARKSISEEKYHELSFALLKNSENKLKNSEEKIARLEKERGIDTLTGVGNLRGLEEKLQKLFTEQNYPKGPKKIMVIAIDINNFKKFNEAPYDHSIGDRALYTFAGRLKEAARESNDAVFRKGGDEFVIVLPIYEDSTDEKVLFAEIKNRVNGDFGIETREGFLKITASMGYAIRTREDRKNMEEILNEADSMERKVKLESKR